MAIEIIVETGAVVENANAYVSVAAVRAYAAERGVTLPVSDDEVAALIIKAKDYLEAFGCKYQGQKISASQALEWPRSGVVVGGVELAPDAIPKRLKDAQCAAVLIQNEGLVLQPNITAQDYVTEETVGPLTTKFADPTKAGITANFTGLDALLSPLFAVCGQSFALRTMRV